MLFKKYVVICFMPLLFSFSDVTAQEDTILYSPGQLQDDARFYFSSLRWKHPNMYCYCDMETFEKKKHDVFQQLTRPMTREEFLMIIGTVNACLDFHSNINMLFRPYLSKWIDSVSNSGNVIFPRVHVKSNKLFTDIKGDRSELLSINGVPVHQMLEFMNQYFGMNSVRWHEYLLESIFAVWAYTYFGIRPPFEVVFNKNNRTRKETLQGITFDEFKKFSCLYRPDSNQILQYKVYPTASIAILTVNTFGSELLDKMGYDNILGTFSDSIQRCNIRHLFIDVSKNGGGRSDKMAKLFDYLHHDTVYFKYVQLSMEHGDILYNPYQGEVVSQPNQSGFNGTLYVLQGTLTCSAADFFCKIVAQNKLGIRIGQNTGSLMKEYTSTNTLTMPNTKIKFELSAVFYDFTHDWNTESLPPDMLWDVDYTGIFTEKELKNIIDHWNKQKSK